MFLSLSTKFLISLLSPDSLAFNDDDNKRYSIREYMESEALKPNLLPGDLILIQTPGTVYKSIRKVMDTCYDHMAVLLDKDTVLHISPPVIRKISSNVFLMKKRNPIIIRPNLTANQREEFVKNVENTLGYKYDYGTLFSLMGKKLYHQISKNFNSNHDPLKIFQRDFAFIDKNLKSSPPSHICTDLLFTKLKEISPEINEHIKNNHNYLNYSYLGGYSPDDLLLLSEKNPILLKAINCYPTDPIRVTSPLQSLEMRKNEDIAVDENASSGINLKKIISVIDKMMFLSNFKENLKEYRKGFSLMGKKTFKKKREMMQGLKLVYLFYSMRKLLKSSENKSLSLAQTRDLLKQGLEIYLLLQDTDLSDLLKRPFFKNAKL